MAGRASTMYLRGAISSKHGPEQLSTYAILEDATSTAIPLSITTKAAVTSFDPDRLRLVYDSHRNPIGKALFDRLFSRAITSVTEGVAGRMASLSRPMGLSQSAMRRGIKRGGEMDNAIHMALNFSGIKEIQLALAGATTVKSRADAFRKAAIDSLDVGFKHANGEDLLSYGFLDWEPARSKITEVLNGLTVDQTNAVADIFEDIHAAYISARPERIKSWRAANAHLSPRMSDDQVAEAAGMGPTLHSYITHLFDSSTANGEMDFLVRQMVESGAIPVGRSDDISVLGQTIRGITSASPAKPYVNRKGVSFTSPVEALRDAVPAFAKDEAGLRVMASRLATLRSASADNTVVTGALPAIRDRFLLKRSGTQGFRTSFHDAYLASAIAHGRFTHFDPVVRPGSPLHELITGLESSGNNAVAASLKRTVRSLMGTDIAHDEAFMEVTRSMAGLAGVAHRAISLGNLGMAVPNLLSFFTALIPEAMAEGRILDAFTAVRLAHNPRFLHLVDQFHLRDDLRYNTSKDETLQLAHRLQSAFATNDLRAGAAATLESVATFGDLLNPTETQFIRPTAAALGAIRYMRATGKSFEQLTPDDLEGVHREILRVTSKITLMPGGSNSIPLMRMIRRNIPVLGPLATMYAATPVTIAAGMVNDIGLMLRGPLHLRGPATRRIVGTATALTLVAGPYWPFPFLRDVEKLPFTDEETTDDIIGALNGIEKRFTLAGLLGSDLSRRISPISGVTERFMPRGADSTTETVLRLGLGPLGSAAADLVEGLAGDEESQRRALGAMAPLVAGLPASGFFPSSMTVTVPGGTMLEKAMRASIIGLSPDLARRHLGMDPQNRPVTRPLLFSSEAMRALLGGRLLDDATISSEGLRAQKRERRRTSVESDIRTAVLDGNLDVAYSLLRENSGLSLDPASILAPAKLNRELLMRKLPPQARALYVGRKDEAIRRARQAAQRLSAGRLTPAQVIHERSMLMAAMLKFKLAPGASETP